MSNRLAIAAVTACLRNLLANALAQDPDLSDAVVTAQPLDKARDPAATANQVNLFLYMIAPNAAWRNQDMPGRTRSGEVATPPLALNLFYLVSAYGRDNDVQQSFSQLLLGQAMGTLYDHPLLGSDEIAAALPGNDLGDQPERVRITLQPLSMEEISKLWAGFQMQYRLSVAYEVAVVLIDPSTPVRAGPPVLARGAGGSGFPVGSDPLAAFPSIAALSPNRPLQLGETATIQAHGIGGGPVTASVTPLRTGVAVNAPTVVADGGIAATIPIDADVRAGPCLLSLTVAAPTGPQTSNACAMMIAPTIISTLPKSVSLASSSALDLTVRPQVYPDQQVALILGDRSIASPSRAAATDRLTFPIGAIAPGTYLVRVRVDGVDSVPVLNPDSAAPTFDPKQVLQVTP